MVYMVKKVNWVDKKIHHYGKATFHGVVVPHSELVYHLGTSIRKLNRKVDQYLLEKQKPEDEDIFIYASEFFPLSEEAFLSGLFRDFELVLEDITRDRIKLGIGMSDITQEEASEFLKDVELKENEEKAYLPPPEGGSDGPAQQLQPKIDEGLAVRKVQSGEKSDGPES
jgi:hypothetical protein